MKRIKLTEEQKKANKKARMKIWREANKERLSKYGKDYREANKDSLTDKRKTYTESNKDKISQYCKTYNKTYVKSQKLKGLYIVYCLPNETIAYAGITNRPNIRMIEHRCNGRNTSDWFILQVCKTREEALKIESEYHKIGYSGAKRM